MPLRNHLALLVVVICLGCARKAHLPSVDLPDLTLSNSVAPSLTTLATGDVLLTALRQTDTGHQLVVMAVGSEDAEDGSSAPLARETVIAEGPDFFANWADVPGLVEAGDGSLIAHWLKRSGTEVYDYGVQLARSVDGGATWAKLGWLNDDARDRQGGAPGEHGFVAWIPEGDGARAFWLDGRTAGAHGDADDPPGGAMQLRTTTVVDGVVAPSELLDERVCDCCPTTAVATPNGLLVAFRDRSEEEIRDVHILRRTADGWQRTIIDTSGWQIPGCPVNGPALAVDGDLVLVAWYTAHPAPAVLAAWSRDGGVTFDEPVLLTADTLGRVTAAILGGAGYVAWLSALEGSGDEMPPGEVRMVRLAVGGELGTPVSIAGTAATRRAGVPRLVVDSGKLGLAWTKVTTHAEASMTDIAYRRVDVRTDFD